MGGFDLFVECRSIACSSKSINATENLQSRVGLSQLIVSFSQFALQRDNSLGDD
jgi:hypothetical protein